MVVLTATEIVYISAEVVVAFVTIIANFVVLIAILRNKSLHTITNVFVGNLAIADIAVGIFVAPCAALSFLGLPRDVYGCIFINSVLLMFTNISSLMLLTIAVERFIAIRFPYLYDKHATLKSSIIANLSIWVVGALLGLLPMMGWNVAPDELTFCAFTAVISMEYMIYFQFFAVTFTPLFVMFCVYLYIFLIVRQHTKQERALQKMFRNENSKEDARSRRKWAKDVEAAKMFALLFFVFALFWLPIYIMNCITLFCPTCNSPYELLLVTIVLSHANSSVNPFLYAANNSRIRFAIKTMFGFHTDSSMNHTNASIQSNKENTERRPGASSGTSDYDQRPVAKEKYEDEQNASDINGVDKNQGISTIVEISKQSPNLARTNHAPVNGSALPENNRSDPITVQGNNRRKQLHSYFQQPDTVDRLVPAEGLMANIYNSFEYGISDTFESSTDDVKEKDSKMITSNKEQNGHINRAFVDDEAINTHSDNAVRPPNNTSRSNDVDDQTIITDVEICKSSIHDSEKLKAKLTRAQNLNSNSVSSSYSVSFSQDSPIIVTNGDLSMHGPNKLDNIGSLGSNHSSKESQKQQTFLERTVSLDTGLTDPHSTTHNVFVLETEDDDMMYVKRLQESQDSSGNPGCNDTVRDDRVRLENLETYTTYL